MDKQEFTEVLDEWLIRNPGYDILEIHMNPDDRKNVQDEVGRFRGCLTVDDHTLESGDFYVTVARKPKGK